jgi:hypothetical protein
MVAFRRAVDYQKIFPITHQNDRHAAMTNIQTNTLKKWSILDI